MCSVNTSTLEVKELIHEVDKPYRDPHARSVEVLNDGKIFYFVPNVQGGDTIIITTVKGT